MQPEACHSTVRDRPSGAGAPMIWVGQASGWRPLAGGPLRSGRGTRLRGWREGLGALGDLGDVRVGLSSLRAPVDERPRVEPER